MISLSLSLLTAAAGERREEAGTEATAAATDSERERETEARVGMTSSIRWRSQRQSPDREKRTRLPDPRVAVQS